MAWALYKGNANATAPTETFIASGAIAKGDVVVLAAGNAGVGKGKVSTYVGISSSAVLMYGVALHAAADTADVLVIPFERNQVWVVDAVANTAATNIAADNYLAATTLLLTVGASTAQGKKCHIIGVLGVTADKKYLVKPANTLL